MNIMNYIKHIIEPNRLLLCWQAPDGGGGSRARRFVGELTRTDDLVELRYLTDSDCFLAAKESGFTWHPAFPKVGKVYREAVLETFMKRLPPRSRPDFNNYLESMRIRPGTQISDFALLAYSGARLPGDGFSIIHPFDNIEGPCEFLTEVAGFRYYEGMNILDSLLNKKVTFKPEPQNPHDPKAILILLGDKKIGYVNRGQLDAFHYWLEQKRITAIIEKVNGSLARPRVLLFVSVCSK